METLLMAATYPQPYAVAILVRTALNHHGCARCPCFDGTTWVQGKAIQQAHA